jgi:hypothetical protein
MTLPDIRNAVNLHLTALPGGVDDGPAVQLRPASQRSLNVGQIFLVGLIPEDVAQMQTVHLLRCFPDPLRYGLVGMLVPMVPVPIAHCGGYAIEDRPDPAVRSGNRTCRLAFGML